MDKFVDTVCAKTGLIGMVGKSERGAIATLTEGGLARVQLAPWRVAQAGIRTVEVGLAPATEELTTVGFVGFDESRHVLVASGTRGRARVDRLQDSRAVGGDPGAEGLEVRSRRGPVARRQRHRPRQRHCDYRRAATANGGEHEGR